MEGLGNHYVLAMIARTSYKVVQSEDGSVKQLHCPDFGLFHIDPKRAIETQKLWGELLYMEESEVEEAAMDVASSGMFEKRGTAMKHDYQLAVVIGENDEARMSEYSPDDWALPESQKRIVRMSRPNRPPKFGDTVLLAEKKCANWGGFYKLPCDTTAANEFLLCNGRRDRWIRVKRSSEVVISDLKDIYFLVKTFEDATRLS